jgi:hypothetical protein
MKSLWPQHRWLVLAQNAYMIWVTIVAALQFTISSDT